MQPLSNMSSIFRDMSVPTQFDVTGVNRTHGTLTVCIESERPKLSYTVIGEKTLCIREFDEGDALTYLDGLRTGLYVCKNSDLLDWFSFSRSPLQPIHGLCHYVLVTSDTVIEWLSTVEPSVSEPYGA
jgi:hypothetical protein